MNIFQKVVAIEQQKLLENKLKQMSEQVMTIKQIFKIKITEEISSTKVKHTEKLIKIEQLLDTTIVKFIDRS